MSILDNLDRNEKPYISRDDLIILARAQQTRIEKLGVMLKKIQWGRKTSNTSWYACPVCFRSHQHEGDCELDALLKEGEK